MTDIAATDRLHMARALALAAQGMYSTTPNPRVGSVIVKNGAVIGEGFHVRPGQPHAEVNALADAHVRGNDPRGATLYVTLEPCNSYGRTPPCVDAVVAAGISRVVAAMRDPNPAQANGGDRLRAAGIDVVFGPLQAEARELNIGFVSRMVRGRPWVRTKLAASLDGRTALSSGHSQWITGEPARADGHAWRARACAVLTGVGTVLQDDPQLTVRAIDTSRQPLRIVIDRHGQTPATARVLADGNVLIVTAGERNAAWPAALDVLTLPNAVGRVDLAALMGELAARGINELHVEAGAKLTGALLDAGLVDELLLYLAPMLIGDPARGMFERAAPLSTLAECDRARMAQRRAHRRRFAGHRAAAGSTGRLMFTGIVQALSRIATVTRQGEGVRLAVDVIGIAVDDVAIGDSVCVNGCCLTVVAKHERRLEFDVSAETLRCTTGLDRPGDVNMELALRLADRLGGHLTSGHVDGVGIVRRFTAIAGDAYGSWFLEIEAPAELARFIAAKGSIAVNGVSLTVNEVAGARFSVNLIPHTLKVTTLGGLSSGSAVNIEIDIVARYVSRLASFSK